MTSRLSKIPVPPGDFGGIYDPHQEAWCTDNYVLLNHAGDDPSYGYDIVNRETGQTEIRIDQEPQGLMAMLWLQEQYEEIMGDPDREYSRRKPRTSGLSEGVPGMRLQ